MGKCKIIKDLFPSYIDGLTNEDTNKYIEEHIKECEKCKEELGSMKKELELETTPQNGKEVKYIKKFSNKMKILKIILLIILLIFVFKVGRNMIIIGSLNNKISNYTVSTNYYVKLYHYSGENWFIEEWYKKDEKYAIKVRIFNENATVVSGTMEDYYNGQTVNSYNETSKKVAFLNKSDDVVPPTIPNKIKIYNSFYHIFISAISSITSEECNGKDCYQIVGLNRAIYYIDKETGLVVRSIGEITVGNDKGEQVDRVTDFRYEFDVVTDDDFIEPDISEYEIKEYRIDN